MKKNILILLIFGIAAQMAFAQRKTVAVLPSDGGSLSQEQTDALTDRVHKAAIIALPEASFTILRQDVVIRRLGGAESYVKECLEGTCIVDMGKKAQADYVAKASVGTLEGKLRLKVELYSVETEGSVDLFDEDYADFAAMRAAIDENVPNMFKKIPSIPEGKAAAPAPGAEGKAADYGSDSEWRYLTSISTNPEGALLSINGEPFAGCAKTPCNVMLGHGKFRIIAIMKQYEKADTSVSISRSNQSVAIKLKPSFGVFEVKPAYIDGMGKDEWVLEFSGKEASSFENKLSPGNYAVRLSSRCYEDISFKIGINKGSHEVFDMAGHAKPKMGGLVLDAVNDGEPASEPVFINGKNAGETPFGGTVPICAYIKIGNDKAAIELKHNQKVAYKHRVGDEEYDFTDSRNGKKFKAVKIGSQMWMAENLNYNYAIGSSKCYDNKEENCTKYGRLYDWNMAKACPNGWHLPSSAEWEKLISYVEKNEDCSNCAGKHLKTSSGWNANKGKQGNGTNVYWFAALPGGDGFSNGSFLNAGDNGSWWSATEGSAAGTASGLEINSSSDAVFFVNAVKRNFRSVRCVQN